MWWLSVLLVVAMGGWGATLWLRHRDALRVQAAANHLMTAARNWVPVPDDVSVGIAEPLVRELSPLLDQLATAQHQSQELDRQLVRVLSELREPLAIHAERIAFANPAFARMLGFDNPQDLLGHPLSKLVAPEYGVLLEAHLRRALAGTHTPSRIEMECRPTAEQLIRIELSQQVVTYQELPALLLRLVEMTPTQPVGSAAKGRSSAWETMDSLGEGVITTDYLGVIEYMNRAAEQLTGLMLGDAVGRSFSDVISLVDELDRHPLPDPVKQALANNARVTAGRRSLMLARNGNEHSVELSVAPLRGTQSDAAGTVILMRDVTELRGLTRQMSYQASHDALTGLVNRREFERRLQESIDMAHATSARHVLCYLDLDRFKNVNDTAGHLAGDGLLREVAALVKDAVRDSDTVGRLGGDEFGIMLSGCPLDKATQIAEDIVRKVKDYRYVWKDKIFTIGVSMGLVEISRESGNIEELMSAADSACYVAKRQNGSSGTHVHVYSSRDEAVARQRGEIQWLQRLQVALKEHQFELMAQPIVAVSPDLRDEGPALEVLLRLRDDNMPEGVPPIEFLRAAERYRLMVDVDRWVVQTSLTALGLGGIRLPPGRSLAINLSGQTLGDSNFLEYVVECLDRTGVSPAQLCFEVTENAVMTNIDLAQRFINVLHGMGCKFALDDFGRGLSSFGNLKHLSIDYLKIDGSFIRNLAVDTVNQAMVSAMVKLARTLNFRVIAEQVEDAASLEAVRAMGVDFVQGYELARPQPLARVVMRTTPV